MEDATEKPKVLPAITKILKAPKNPPKPSENICPSSTSLPKLDNQPGIKKTDFVMRGDPRIPNPGPERILPRSPPKNQFTTTMRQKYSQDEIYKEVLDTGVTLPLGKFLSICPDLERTLAG